MTTYISRPPTVVLVEDDAPLREALQYALEIEGYPVLSCESGEALLAADLPDAALCLVVDFHLRGMNGVDALDALRERDVSHPTIVITTAPSLRLRAWAHLNGATLIEKPLLEDVLIGAIRAVT